MIATLDSSVLIAALVDSQAHHAECFGLLRQPDLHMLTHALRETFSTLTGGRLGIRISAETAASMVRQSIIPFVKTVDLSASEVLTTLEQAEAHGVRGGAIYDYLHLIAARKAQAARLYTLNISNFRSFCRSGDPEIVHP